MRFFLGMIVGCALTIAAAYLLDNRSTVASTDTPTTTVERPMVNWDVVSRNWQQFSDRVRGEWRRLSNG